MVAAFTGPPVGCLRCERDFVHPWLLRDPGAQGPRGREREARASSQPRDWAKEKFRVWDQTCLSYGPCQTPTLWFCVERHKEIERFRHQDTFTPSVTAIWQLKLTKYMHGTSDVGQAVHRVTEVNIEEYPVELRWVEGTTLDQQRAQSLERKLQAEGTCVAALCMRKCRDAGETA